MISVVSEADGEPNCNDVCRSCVDIPNLHSQEVIWHLSPNFCETVSSVELGPGWLR